MTSPSIQKGTRSNTVALTPTRQFIFILDPQCVPSLVKGPYVNVLRLIADLKLVEPPITIHLLLAEYLAEPAIVQIVQSVRDLVSSITGPLPPPFQISPDVPREIRARLVADSESAKRSVTLLALATDLQADGIITDHELLIDSRYPLYQHHRIRVVPLVEFGDVIEICAHGHSIFWSVSNEERRLTFDLFYQWTHWKNARFAKWFNTVNQQITNQELQDCLRSALLNRYSFILYSRDMIMFYDLQKDFYSRRGLLQRYAMAIGYYVTSFYLLLWGMLDHLTIIAKFARHLKVGERQCGIKSDRFWKEFQPMEPGLMKFLESKTISEWLSYMADMRHAAAHRTIAIPTPLLADTEESKKDEQEILRIIRKKNSFMYQVLSAEVMRSLEPMMVWHWRIDHMKMVAPSIVHIRKQDAAYLRDPVISVDYDLEVLTAIMDAFLVRLFNGI